MRVKGVACRRFVMKGTGTDLLGDDVGGSIDDFFLSKRRYSGSLFFEPAIRVLDDFVEGRIYADEPTQ